MENKKPEALWYLCLNPYKHFVPGKCYRLEIHGEPHPAIQVAFDLRYGWKINPNHILGISDSLDGFYISRNAMMDLEYIDYSKLKQP